MLALIQRVTGNRSIKVVDKNGKVWAKDTVASETVKDVQGYKYWTFNGDMTAEATVEPYKVVTTGTSSNLTVTKEDVPTIYAYDFFPVNAPANDAGTIAYSWNNESMEKAADAIGKANFTAENGRGVAGMAFVMKLFLNGSTSWTIWLSMLTMADM